MIFYLSGPFLSLLFCDLQNTKNIKNTNKKIQHILLLGNLHGQY